MKKVTLKFKDGSLIPEFKTTGEELFAPRDILRMKKAIDYGYRLWKKEQVINGTRSESAKSEVK
jgi:hypothetical protein